MKKSIFLFFAAILCAMSVSAKTIYLHTGGGGLWNQGGAKFGCHTWGKTEKSGFMTHVEGDIYSFETDDANTDVIFTRVQSSATGIWDKEWNRIQTKIPADKDLCTITGWGGSDYKWSDYAPLASHTFTKNSTLYIDFRAITSDKKGANYPKAGSVGIDYSANAGGTVIPVTFTADVKWAEGTEFIKTDQGGWASIPFKAPSAGQNCAQVAADGKSYTWTTYSEPTVTLSLDKESADAGTEVTVTLTATADNVAGEVTYAFQYSTDNITWNNISSTGNTATQTFAAETRYYKVTMTNGGNTKEATAKFSAIKFHVIGSWDNWNTHNETVEGDVTLALEANKTYEYKITNGTWDIHWGNDGTMTRDNCTDWSFESDNNAKITTDEAGNYVFNVSRNDEGKVKVSVTYPVLTYTVNATAENGTVTGAGTYAQGTEVTLTATPAEGYEFVNWTVGGKEVSAKNPYEFTVTENVDLVANFAKNVYTVRVTAENGSVDGDGEYTHGEQATLTATAAEGYEFTCWTSGEDTVSTENPYKFPVTANVDLVANFEKAATEIVLENAYKEVYLMWNYAKFFGEHATYGKISVQVNNYNGYGTYAEGVSSRIGDVRVNGSATFENKGETDLLTATLTDEEGTVYIVKAEVPTPKTYEVVATNATYLNLEGWSGAELTVNGLTLGEEELTLTVYWDGVGGSEEGYEASTGLEGSIQGVILVEKGEDDVLSFEGTLKDASDNSYIFNFTATPKAAETYTLTFEDMVIEPDQWSKKLNISAENEDYAIEFFLFDGQTKGYGEYGFTDGYPDVDEVYINFEYAQLKEGTVAKYYKNEETGLATIEATFLLGIDTYIVTLTGEPLVNPEDIVPTDTINITMTEGTIGLVSGMVKVAASSEEADLSIVLVGGDPYAGVTTKDFAAASYLVTTAGSLTFLRGGLEIVEVGDVKIAYIGVLCSDHKWYNIVLTTGTEAPTALDNLNTTVAPVKMIENGQLIIIKNGVQHNAQGAILK